MENFDWSSLISDDINISCQQWQSKFLSIVQKCIPKGVLQKEDMYLGLSNKSEVPYASETYFTKNHGFLLAPACLASTRLPETKLQQC